MKAEITKGKVEVIKMPSYPVQSPAMAETGYEPKSTFWMDFCIADDFGSAAVRDTYRRAFAAWKGDFEMLTELVMVLNHKIWQHYQKRPALGLLYNHLWKEADEYACQNLQGEELQYFYRTLD